MNEIKIVNLITGAPIIAKVSVEDDYYVLEDPFNILYVPPKEEGGRPTFTVFDMTVLSSESEIEVATKHVMYCNTPTPEIIEQYNNMLLNHLTPIADDD
jgi:hypothetical protein